MGAFGKPSADGQELTGQNGEANMGLVQTQPEHMSSKRLIPEYRTAGPAERSTAAEGRPRREG